MLPCYEYFVGNFIFAYSFARTFSRDRRKGSGKIRKAN